jgi:hypothetical protein
MQSRFDALFDHTHLGRIPVRDKLYADSSDRQIQVSSDLPRCSLQINAPAGQSVLLCR